jgi:5,6-dimethylbenzimidazole synthase
MGSTGTAGTGAKLAFDESFRHQLGELLAWRRDVRRFRDDPLPPGAIDELIATACLAPSAQLHGQLAEHVDSENLRAAADLRAEDRAHYMALKLHGLREAPELLAVFCDERPAAGRGLGRRTMPETLRYSTVLAIHTLWLAGRARGIGVGWVSILEAAAVARLLQVPADWSLVGLLCVGFPDEEHDVPELVRAGWQERRSWQHCVIER